MAMAPQGQAEHEHEHDHQHGLRSQPNSSHNLWEPYSSAGDYARTMALILAAFLTAMALGLALDLATSYLLGRIRRARRGRAGSGSGEAPPPPPPALVYSSTSTNLAGAAVECAICLTEFADGDAIRFMPACRHGFHARCIDRWLAGGRRSSCPTCRAPTTVATGAAAATQPDEAAASSS